MPKVHGTLAMYLERMLQWNDVVSTLGLEGTFIVSFQDA